ncbi:MAG: hypothetical protein GDA43_14210 [Hormoscilla sp. SP5CHS1]|nr:hypothetical protein [Hormoscilla sp. SP12CHS1]MBC6454201.1 hypothetical protein [Hormoscilla sp. SP5CHS1]MBC6471844.1 hypothetical protein [Hormoscilla sp. GM102CHS1]
MLKIRLGIIFTTIAAMMFVTAARGNPKVVQVVPTFEPDPLELTRGTSIGSSSNNCANLASEPNIVVQLTQDISSMRFILQSAVGQPILKIDGPNSIPCLMADGFSGGKIEVPGYWPQGTYSIYIGDRASGPQDYTLSISSQ